MLHFRFAWISRFLISLGLLALGLTVLAAGTASAQDRRQNAPGEFDFYVLSLSWSPSFCEEASERGNEGRSQAQCGGRPFSFVVHGLWPQYEHGFPEYCQRPSPRLDRNIMSSMLDLMPAPGLIFNEWDKHGTCSGLAARAYFETIRKARAAVKIPPEYLELSEAKTVAPAEIEDAFIKANPGLSTCGDRGDLQPDAAQRGADLHEQGPAVPRLRGNRPPRLPPRRGHDAAAAGRLSSDSVIPGWCAGPDLRCAIAHRGIRRFRVRDWRAPRNDEGYFRRLMS